MKIILKFFTYFVILFGLICDCKHQHLEHKVHNECQSDPTTQIDENVLLKFSQGEQVDEDKIGAYLFCSYTKLNILEKNGEINKDTIKRNFESSHFSQSKINDIIEECTTIKTRENKIVAVKLSQCLNKNTPQYLNHFKLKREEEFINASLECQSNPETAADKNEIIQLKNNEDIDNSKIRQHVLCVIKKVSMLDEHDDVNIEVIKKDLWVYDNSKAEIEEIIKECAGKSDDNIDGAAALKLFKCLRKYWVEPHFKFNKVQERKEIFKKIHEVCQSNPATKIDEEVLKSFRKGEKINDPQLPRYVLCVNQKSEIQDENGNVNRETIKKYLETFFDDEDKITDIVDECAVRSNKDSAEETAVKVLQCLHKPEHHRHHRKHHKH